MIKLVGCIVLFSLSVRSADILGIIPSPFYSHQAFFRPLWTELAKRGHQITLITTHLMEPNENITQIDYSGMIELNKRLGLEQMFLDDLKLLNVIKTGISAIEKSSEFQFSQPGLLDLLRSKKHFDLLLIEMLMPNWACLSHKLNVPFISIVSMEAIAQVHSSMGNAIHPAIYPQPDYGYQLPLTFRERLYSTALMNGIRYFFHSFLGTGYGIKYSNKYFEDDCPTDVEMLSKASLVLENSNPIFYDPRPMTPLTINLEGGMHILPPKPLPQDLGSFLDEATSGVIYFSLGTTVNSNTLTREARDIFISTFEDLAPIKVLWKFENETLKNKPKNLVIKKWLPQQDVLRHPNIKLFITQGGLQSMEEAIDNAVPMLGFPFYGDQHNNVNKMVAKKFGLSLDVKTLTKGELKETILKLLRDPLYKSNAEKYSKIQKDRFISPLNKGVWWIEYVLRHGNTNHLHSPSADIPFYQYFFLDILSFFLFILIIVIIILYLIIKAIVYFGKKLLKSNKDKIK